MSANPLHHRDYALLLAGRFIAQAGHQMQVAALAWHVHVLSGESVLATATGLGLARGLPVILMALTGGVLADATDRRRLLMAAQVMAMAISGALAAATVLGIITVPMIYALTAGWGIVAALDNPARQALIANLVPEMLLAKAMGQSSIAFHVARVLGPVVGLAIVAAAGVELVYAANAAAFGVLLATLAALRFRPAVEPKIPPGWEALKEGWSYVRRTPVIWGTMWLDFFATLLADSLLLLPAFATQYFDVGAQGYGALLSAHGAGALVVACVMALRPPPRRQGLAILISVGVYGAAFAAFGLTASFPVALGMMAVAGATDTVSSVLRSTLRQLETPDALRGRMNSINMIFYVGGPQLGEAEAGVVAELWGVRSAVTAGGLACLTLALGALAFNRTLRNYTGREPSA